MNFLKHSLLGVLIVWLPTNCVPAQWTIFVYSEAEGMADAALKHLNDMASGYKAQHALKVNVIVQVHSSGPTAWRYEIKEKSIHTVEEVEISTSCPRDFQEALTWAFKNYPAKQKALILSGHGFGVIEPLWDKQRKQWYHPYEEREHSSTSKELLERLESHAYHKYLLPRTSLCASLTINEVATALKKVVEQACDDKQLDIIGLDACGMGMLEVAYALAPYGRYCIASQECESTQGWDYKALVDSFCNNIYEPYQIARSIVYSYKAYYQSKKASRFTLSALDLSYMVRIKEHIEQLASLLISTQEQYKEPFSHVLLKARDVGPEFCCAPFYKDLYSFYEALFQELEGFEQTESMSKLKQELVQGMLLLDQAIIAYTSSTSLKNAHGLSLYFPLTFNHSYLKTLFAQESLWTEFIKTLKRNSPCTNSCPASLILLERAA